MCVRARSIWNKDTVVAKKLISLWVEGIANEELVFLVKPATSMKLCIYIYIYINRTYFILSMCTTATSIANCIAKRWLVLARKIYEKSTWCIYKDTVIARYVFGRTAFPRLYEREHNCTKFIFLRRLKISTRITTVRKQSRKIYGDRISIEHCR